MLGSAGWDTAARCKSRKKGEGLGSLLDLPVEEPVCRLHEILEEKIVCHPPPDCHALKKVRSLKRGRGLQL